MEALYKFIALIVFCAPGILCGCKEDIGSDSKAMECMMKFSQFMGSKMQSVDMSDPEAPGKIICSDEGKAAFGCVIDIMVKCPELMQTEDGTNPMASLSSIGFNMSSFFTGEGMEAICAMMVGPCSEVKQCMEETPTNGGMMKRGAPMDSTNHYLMFMMQAKGICGNMKSQMMCMLEKLEHCPASVVDQIEKSYEMIIKAVLPDQQGITGFKDMKKFITEDCNKLETESMMKKEACARDVFLGTNFTECHDTVVDEYKSAKTCLVYQKSTMCIKDQLGSACGEEIASFYNDNTHLVFAGIPDDCAEQINAGNTAAISFGVLLMSLLSVVMS